MLDPDPDSSQSGSTTLILGNNTKHKLSVNFFLCLYLSRNAHRIEESVVQSGSRLPVQVNPDLIIAQTILFTYFAKKNILFGRET
jgi:hypothetical protein